MRLSLVGNCITSEETLLRQFPIRFTVDAKTPKGLQHIAHPIKVGRETVNITLDVLVK